MRTMLLTLATLLFSAQVFATTTLRIPIAFQNERTEKPVSTAKINAKLQAAGLPSIPAYIEVSTGDDFYTTIENALKPIYTSLAAAGYGDDIVLQDLYDGPAAGTCYIGNPHEAVEIVANVAGSFYSEQMSLWAYKYNSDVHYFEYTTENDSIDYLDSESAVWKNWNSFNDDILILYAVTDGGEDVNEAVIVKCQ